MTADTIPAEAIAAIAAHFHAATCRAASLNAACDGATTADFELARYALTAALPHLPGHQRDAYEAGYEAAFESWSELLDCAAAWPPSPRTAFIAGYEAGAARAAAAERERWVAVLAEHYLMGVNCGDVTDPDEHPGEDNPICGCSRVFLGWHPSIGAARQAWIDHAADLLAATPGGGNDGDNSGDSPR